MSNESTFRSRARRRGYYVEKSRQWKHVPHLDNFGRYMLIDANSNFVVLGARYDATLEDIDAFLKESEQAETETAEQLVAEAKASEQVADLLKRHDAGSLDELIKRGEH